MFVYTWNSKTKTTWIIFKGGELNAYAPQLLEMIMNLNIDKHTRF